MKYAYNDKEYFHNGTVAPILYDSTIGEYIYHRLRKRHCIQCFFFDVIAHLYMIIYIPLDKDIYDHYRHKKEHFH